MTGERDEGRNGPRVESQGPSTETLTRLLNVTSGPGLVGRRLVTSTRVRPPIHTREERGTRGGCKPTVGTLPVPPRRLRTRE